MILRLSVCLASLLALLWAPAHVLANDAEDEPRLYPAFRFAESETKEVFSEYVGAPNGHLANAFLQLPVGEGNMRVDCQVYSVLGFAFEPVGIGSHIYGANTKYHAEWTHSEFPGQSLEGMSFRPSTRSGFMITGVPLDDWRVDGTVQLVIRVEGEVVYETAFDLESCLANMYRTPTPPSEMIRRYEEGDSDSEQSSREE